MLDNTAEEKGYLKQLRLMLEELCCELCQFEHAATGDLKPERVRIDREYSLGKPGAFADIRIIPASAAPYLVEVKFGYPIDRLLSHLRRKYSEPNPALAGIGKIILVIDSASHPDWPRVEAEVAKELAPGLELEVWNESKLIQLLHDRFHIEIPAITPANLLEVRHAIDRAQGYFAFGGQSLTNYEHEPLNEELLWHFGSWKLRHLRETKHLRPCEILPPGLYRGVVVLLADLCSFSSYVRDTPDGQVVRESLTSFYSKSRYQIINSGGCSISLWVTRSSGFSASPTGQQGSSRPPWKWPNRWSASATRFRTTGSVGSTGCKRLGACISAWRSGTSRSSPCVRPAAPTSVRSAIASTSPPG